jgi:hypothetical protein
MQRGPGLPFHSVRNTTNPQHRYFTLTAAVKAKYITALLSSARGHRALLGLGHSLVGPGSQAAAPWQPKARSAAAYPALLDVRIALPGACNVHAVLVVGKMPSGSPSQEVVVILHHCPPIALGGLCLGKKGYPGINHLAWAMMGGQT